MSDYIDSNISYSINNKFNNLNKTLKKQISTGSVLKVTWYTDKPETYIYNNDFFIKENSKPYFTSEKLLTEYELNEFCEKLMRDGVLKMYEFKDKLKG